MIPHIESARWNTIEKGEPISQEEETEQQGALEDLLLEYT